MYLICFIFCKVLFNLPNYTSSLTNFLLFKKTKNKTKKQKKHKQLLDLTWSVFLSLSNFTAKLYGIMNRIGYYIKSQIFIYIILNLLHAVSIW
jgi:hypothetical protein